MVDISHVSDKTFYDDWRQQSALIASNSSAACEPSGYMSDEHCLSKADAEKGGSSRQTTQRSFMTKPTKMPQTKLEVGRGAAFAPIQE